MVCKKFRCLNNLFIFFKKRWLTWIQGCTCKSIDIEITDIHVGITLSSAYTLLKSHISGINILCILRFAKNYTHENKDTTFDHEIAKFDTREKFRLYSNIGFHSSVYIGFVDDFTAKKILKMLLLLWTDYKLPEFVLSKEPSSL